MKYNVCASCWKFDKRKPRESIDFEVLINFESYFEDKFKKIGIAIKLERSMPLAGDSIP